MIVSFYKILFVSAVLCASSAKIRAQNHSEPALKKIAIELNLEHEQLKPKLLFAAQQNHWQRYKVYKNGQIRSLQDIDPNGMPLFYVTENNTIAAVTTKTTSVYPGGSLGLNLNGSSSILIGKVGIWDGGNVLETHQEFTGGRIENKDGAPVVGHSTHVAGTMMARGAHAPARGMSYGLPKLFVHDFSRDRSEMASEAANSNTIISNHSYGIVAGWYYETEPEDGGAPRWEFYGAPGANEDYKFGFYDSSTQEWDRICFNAPFYLPVKSSGNNRNDNGPPIGEIYYRYNSSGQAYNAGPRPPGISSNDGYDILPTYSTAKNNLTIGAVEGIPTGYSGPASVKISAFSSWGPTDDGRIKPDLVGMGVSVLSTFSNSNSSYATLSGTSMSSPNVAGSLVLLQEQFYQTYNRFMRAATLKGLAIHTAEEAGSSAGPDYIYGWGLLNIEKAAKSIIGEGTTSVIAERELLQGDNQVIRVTASGNEPIKATLSWTDPEGTATTGTQINNRTPKLVNDLDLRIMASGTTFLPWILDPENPAKAAIKGDNFRDNVEQVVVDNPIAGVEYAISVTGKGTLRNSKQGYSLLVSGITKSTDVLQDDGTLVVYPVPTSGEFIVKFTAKTQGEVVVTVSNILGQVLIIDKTPDFIGVFGKAYDISSQPNGTYLVRITAEGKSEVRKVLVHKP